MALEIAYIRVIVGGEETDSIVDLCAGVDDTLGVVAEARKVDAVLLALELFCMLAFFAVVDLQCVVVAGYNGEFARVVKVERGNGRAVATGLEAL